jgi:hypothetical protein
MKEILGSNEESVPKKGTNVKIPFFNLCQSRCSGRKHDENGVDVCI